MIRQKYNRVISKRSDNRIFYGHPRFFVNNRKDGLNSLSGRFLGAPSSEFGCNFIQERDQAVFVCDDDGIANARECDLKLLSLFFDFMRSGFCCSAGSGFLRKPLGILFRLAANR